MSEGHLTMGVVTRNCVLLFCDLMLLPMLAISALGQGEIRKPIAIDRHPRGDLYVLGSSGSVTEIGLMPKYKGRLRTILPPRNRIMYGSESSDIVAAELSGQECLFISGLLDGRAQITQIDLDGHLQRVYSLPFPGAGFDIDVNEHLIYIASGYGGEIWRFNIATEEKLHPLSVLGAKSLGPLVISLGQRSVYVADQGSGTVFQLSIADGELRSSYELGGQPTALAFDEQIQRLYVADAESGKIFRVTAKSGRVSTVVTMLHNVTGVAPGPLGSVFVSDADSNAVYQFSDDGKLMEKFQ